VFVPDKYAQPSLIFISIGTTILGFFYSRQNVYVKDEHSSLFWRSLNEHGKKFDRLQTRERVHPVFDIIFDRRILQSKYDLGIVL
jgi:hypothetical protein